MAGIWQKLSSRLIDTHCHVHHYDNSSELVEKLKSSGMTVHLVTVKPEEYDSCVELTRDCPRIHPCIGLFPLYVKECQQQLPLFWEKLEETRYVGEIGLDFSIEDEDELSLQKETFSKIISRCNDFGGKILSVHSRRSSEAVLSEIGSDFNGSVIMHWYSGPLELALSSPENIYFSINTAMLKSRQGKKLIRSLRPEQVLTETDGPYVTIDGRPAEPEDIRNVINALSVHWGCDIESALVQVEQNYKSALDLSPFS